MHGAVDVPHLLSLPNLETVDPHNHQTHIDVKTIEAPQMQLGEKTAGESGLGHPVPVGFPNRFQGALDDASGRSEGVDVLDLTGLVFEGDDHTSGGEDTLLKLKLVEKGVAFKSVHTLQHGQPFTASEFTTVTLWMHGRMPCSKMVATILAIVQYRGNFDMCWSIRRPRVLKYIEMMSMSSCMPYSASRLWHRWC